MLERSCDMHGTSGTVQGGGGEALGRGPSGERGWARGCGLDTCGGGPFIPIVSAALCPQDYMMKKRL